MMQVKCFILTTQKGTFCSFERKINCRGQKANLVKEKIRKKWIETGNQPYTLPLIFVKPQILESISKKLNKKAITIEIDISEVLSFNSLKNYLIKQFTS